VSEEREERGALKQMGWSNVRSINQSMVLRLYYLPSLYLYRVTKLYSLILVSTCSIKPTRKHRQTRLSPHHSPSSLHYSNTPSPQLCPLSGVIHNKNRDGGKFNDTSHIYCNAKSVFLLAIWSPIPLWRTPSKFRLAIAEHC